MKILFNITTYYFTSSQKWLCCCTTRNYLVISRLKTFFLLQLPDYISANYERLCKSRKKQELPHKTKRLVQGVADSFPYWLWARVEDYSVLVANWTYVAIAATELLPTNGCAQRVGNIGRIKTMPKELKNVFLPKKYYLFYVNYNYNSIKWRINI